MIESAGSLVGGAGAQVRGASEASRSPESRAVRVTVQLEGAVMLEHKVGRKSFAWICRTTGAGAEDNKACQDAL